MKPPLNTNGIDCDFSKEDAFVYATTEEYAKKLKTELAAYQEPGIEGDLVRNIPFDIPIKAALQMRNQAQYHPLKFLKGAVREAVSAGCLVYEIR